MYIVHLFKKCWGTSKYYRLKELEFDSIFSDVVENVFSVLIQMTLMRWSGFHNNLDGVN